MAIFSPGVIIWTNLVKAISRCYMLNIKCLGLTVLEKKMFKRIVDGRTADKPVSQKLTLALCASWAENSLCGKDLLLLSLFFLSLQITLKLITEIKVTCYHILYKVYMSRAVCMSIVPFCCLVVHMGGIDSNASSFLLWSSVYIVKLHKWCATVQRWQYLKKGNLF